MADQETLSVSRTVSMTIGEPSTAQPQTAGPSQVPEGTSSSSSSAAAAPSPSKTFAEPPTGSGGDGRTKLLDKRRQVFEVEEALSTQKENYQQKEEIFNKREDSLRRKDLELQEMLIRFNQIITENESKRARAEKKAVEDKVAAAAKEEEIAGALVQLQTLRQELASLHEQKAKLQKHFAYLDIYQREHNEEFTDIHAVLERFMTLKNAHSDLLGEQQRVMSEIEEMRRQVAKAQKAVSMQLINSENLTTRLKAHLDEKRALTAALQSGADEVAVRKGLRILELGQVLQSVYNLHSRCTNSSHGHNLRHSPADGIALGYGRSFRNLRKRMIAAATGGRTPGASTASAASGEGEGEGGSSSAGGTGSSSGADDAGPNGEDSEDDDDSSSSDDEGGHGDDGDDDDDDGARGSPASSPKRKQPAGSPGGAGAEGGEGAAGAGGSPAGSPQRSPGPGKGQGQSSSTPAPVSNKDLAAMDPKVLKKRLRQAVALLNVVGSYIVDLQAIQNEYGAYQAEQRRKAAEREAVLQEEAIKLAAARASKMGGADGKAAQAAVAALEKAVQEKPGTAAGGAARVGATTAAGLAALITSGGGSLPAGVRLGAASAALLPTKSMGGALALGGAVGLSSMGGTGDKTGIAVTGTSNSFLARGSVRVWPRKGQHIPGSVVSKLVAGPAQLEGGK